MKRSVTNPCSLSKPHKKCRYDNFNIMKKIITRNDTDPHVLSNIDSIYVKIGNSVYKTKKFDNYWKIGSDNIDNVIGLNVRQQADNAKFMSGGNILVSAFYTEILPTKKITLSLNTGSKLKIRAKYDNIILYIKKIFDNHIVCHNQLIDLEYQGAMLNICVSDMDEVDAVGKIDSTTTIEFNHISSNIVISKDPVKIDSNLIKVYITDCVNIKSHLNTFPLTIDRYVLDKYVRIAFNDEFANNEIHTFSDDKYIYTFRIKVNSVNTDSGYTNVYQLKPDNRIIRCYSNTDNIIITNGTQILDKICFSLCPVSGVKYNISDYIVSLNTVVTNIRKNIKSTTSEQSYNVEINSRDVKLSVSDTEPFVSSDTRYLIDISTKITLDTSKKSEFIIVKNSEAESIKTITFKIKKSTSIMESLMGPLSNNKKKDSTLYAIDTKKMRKIVSKIFSNITAVGHSATITYRNNDFIVCVKHIILDEGNYEPNLKNNYQAYIADNTEIKFVISKKDKNIIISDTSDVTETETVNPAFEIEKTIGGLSNEIKKVIRSICLSRGKLRDEFIARGLKPVRGIMLHGPPGTGKTSMARILGKILGCTDDRFKLMSGPEIFNKWLGESEANVRAIFKPAKEAWKKLGAKAPTYMVVIDEIDAMLSVRDGSSGNSARVSVVNQFLAEMDGLVQFQNLICIGITNRLDMIDPAAIRAGRFGVHIKIDLPDRNGRLDIFKIHTRKINELGRLSNVNMEELADLTTDYSGADIEGIVDLASTYSLERLNEMDLDIDTIEKHGHIKHSDFINAIKEYNDSNKKKSENKNYLMYT